ncbi:uncharacterized protein LOC123310425 [Coccinella septempunctata]|uniref:uncharacterized protein LOC123310425 n=1 Tax=Coccinella septempunctata TaxID=41139 RepID=UPI001D094CC2|nr:uncharacterized protein LOC123310425 [Coccinella septempunctata]
MNEPDAVNTVLGYILMGTVQTASPSVSSFFIQSSEPINVENTLKAFWEVEEVPVINKPTPDEVFCENHFKNSHFRDESGRYTVSLPFRDVNPVFPGIRDLALSHFYSLERRLSRNPDIRAQYLDFMREYLDQNHMGLVPDNEIDDDAYYIPHHCVLKPSSLTTKLRVVFNASAKLPGQKSLNDCLHTGPKLQQDIVEILMNFRCHFFVICSDIKSMYRMILVNSNDIKYQRILWRFSPDEPVRDYNLLTVVYGISSSPYLALKVLLQLAEDEGESFPLAAEQIRKASYVDDFVGGASTIEEARTLVKELIALMRRGGFELRKWSSNEPSLISDLPESHLSTQPRSFNEIHEATPLKVLGLHWDPTSDHFYFESKFITHKSCTKRILLSELAKTYDPLGFLTPCLVLVLDSSEHPFNVASSCHLQRGPFSSPPQSPRRERKHQKMHRR